MSGSSTGQLSVGSSNPVTLTSTGLTSASSFTVGNSSQVLTLASTSSNVNGGIQLASSSASATKAVSVRGITPLSSTTLARIEFNVDGAGYTVASGSGTHNLLKLTNTYNLTGTASGTQVGIEVAPTLTSLANGQFWGLYLNYNNSKSKGIYQSGASTVNIINGNTMFGSTSDPSAVAAIEISSTTKGLLLPRMTTTQRDAITAVAGLVIYNTTTTKMECYDGATWQAAW